MSRGAARGARPALAALLLLAPVAAAADEGAAPGGGAGARPAGPDWFAFPAVFYMPETRLGGGGLAGVHFPFAPALPTSDVQLIAVATVNRQALGDLRAQLFPSPGLALGGALKAAVFPDLFYGVGNRAPESARESFTSRYLELLVAPEWYLLPGRLRSGPRAWFRRERFGGFAPGGALASGALAGAADGYGATALGWSLIWDDRDSRFAPRTGRSVEAWYLYAPGILGDRLRFGRAALDARQFLPLGGSLVLGLAAHVEAAHGDVPFTLLPRVGGDRHLRGYYEGRWRDRLLYAGQAELRFPIAGRFWGAAFGGLSDVAARPSGFGVRTIRPAAGAGLRYRLTADGLAVRFDAGVGQEGANLYFNLGEAF